MRASSINKAIGIAAVGGAVALVTWFVVDQWVRDAPNRAAMGALEAVRAERPGDLAKFMDGARIEAELKSEIEGAIQYRKDHPEQPGLFNQLFGGMLMLLVLPEILTAPVNPDGAKAALDAVGSVLNPKKDPDPVLDIPVVAHALAEPKAFGKFVALAMSYADARKDLLQGDAEMRDFVRRRIEMPDAGTRIVTLSPNGLDIFVQSKESKLVFERRGWVDWKLVRIDLPDDGGPLFQQQNETPKDANPPESAAPAGKTPSARTPPTKKTTATPQQ